MTVPGEDCGKAGRPLSRQRRYQLARMAEGRCALCGQPRVTADHCAAHAEARRARDRIRYRRRKAECRCVQCGGPLDAGTDIYCAAHAEANRVHVRAWWRRRREKGGDQP